MNTTDFDAPPDRGELQGLLRNAVDAIRAVPPPPTLLTGSDGPSLVQTVDQCEPETNSSQPASLVGVASWKRFVRRLILLAAAAAVFAAVWIAWPRSAGRGPGTDAFAETLAQIEKAKTITWKTTAYEHVRSKDGKRTWLHTEVMEYAYKTPGLYRRVWLDDKGQVQSVEITDYVRGRQLTYNLEKKAATLQDIATVPANEINVPFSGEIKRLKQGDLEWVGTRKAAAGEVNVFRHRFPARAGRMPDRGNDYWIDSKTKQLVAVCDPGADIYDPDHDPARDNLPEPSRSGMTVMGGRDLNIRYDVPLDDSLFRTEAPEGYTVEVKPRDHVTEKQMIEYIGIVADANGKMFPDELSGPFIVDVINRAESKPRKDRTPAEQRLYDTDQSYAIHFGNGLAPIAVFFHGDPDSIVKGTFRYLGKGVKLGDKDRIVCWYKLKDAKDPRTYRVVYGDLTVKDVVPEALPLPVDP
jgi:hypothetical protein